MKQVVLEKYHCMGNDYLVFDPNKNDLELNAENIKKMCSRHFGIGADGILMGVFYELLQKNPEKKFFSVGHRQFCPNMKKIHLDSVLRALGNPEEEVEMDETMRQRAVGPLARMLELAK